MTVSSDVGDSLDVHPRNKRIVAQRLAASALHHAYGYSKVVPNGPRPLKAVSSKPGMVTVYFDTAEGLRWLRGDVLKHFELGGKTGLYVSASKVLVQGKHGAGVCIAYVAPHEGALCVEAFYACCAGEPRRYALFDFRA